MTLMRRFAASTHLGGATGFEIHEPLATKMAGHPHDLKPFELLSPSYRYYDYEFQRYWYFFQVFGRVSYNPGTPAEEWNHEFVARFGKDAAPYIKQGLQRASQILPEITAYCQPADHYPTTRGWPERQRQGDLPQYVEANPSDTQQFESIKDAADDILTGRSSPKITPMQTSRWFARASSNVRKLIAAAEQKAGPHPGKEFASTIVDLKILSDLAAYHSHRAAAGLSYALFEKTHDLNALDDAIHDETEATGAWADIVRDAGDVYNFDLMMGLPQADLSGHWRDELVKLKDGLAALKKQRERVPPGGSPRSRTIRFRQRTDPARLSTNWHLPRGLAVILVTLDVPDGRYEVTVGIHDDKASHGPMWIEVKRSRVSRRILRASRADDPADGCDHGCRRKAADPVRPCYQRRRVCQLSRHHSCWPCDRAYTGAAPGARAGSGASGDCCRHRAHRRRCASITATCTAASPVAELHGAGGLCRRRSRRRN